MVKLCALVMALAGVVAAATNKEPVSSSQTPVPALIAKAREQTKRTPRVPLSDSDDKTPNFVRALALTPKAAQPMQDLFEAVVYHGAIEPEVKLAMALRIAQVYGSAYLAVHAERLLQTTEEGRTLLSAMGSGQPTKSGSSEDLALSYAEKLTRAIHGVSDTDFRLVRTRFNDSQVVELTTTTCFFNYLVRFVEALNLPVEAWALEPASVQQSKVNPPIARVALISDDEIEAVQARLKAQQAAPSNWNIGFANSMRAMLRSPAVATAWMKYGNTTREYASVDRTLKLHISFAVSMANGCRYCTLHQVLGLRRQGVDISKLVAMEKDDSQLSPRELTAVQFARKLTTRPTSITDADYDNLKREFGEQGALEVVQQTCNFAYMNRFTDGLRLPSEDEAVRVYQETYGHAYSR